MSKQPKKGRPPMAPQKAARVRAGLRALVKRHGSGGAAAKAIGVTPTAVNACLRGATGPSRRLAEATAAGLGLTSTVLYETHSSAIERMAVAVPVEGGAP